MREPIEITIEPHAISILSHSGPDRSISEESLRAGRRLQTRRYRNRHLGEYLKELDLSEGRATGIPTIQDELERNGSPLATFETDADRSYFLITIPCHSELIGVKHEPLNEPLNERQLKILELLKLNAARTMAQMANALNCSRSTIKRDIERLILLGKIQREGSKKTAHWVVIETPSIVNEPLNDTIK